MILSFPYLVVILTTLGTPKNIFCINNNIMNDNSKQNKTTRARASLVVLYLRNYAAGIHGHYHESSDHFEYPKKSILKSSHPKTYLPNLHTQKNPGIENFKPNKILRSSPSLEVRSTPPGHIGLLRIVKLAENNTFLSRSYVKTRRHLLMKHKHNTNTL